MLNTEAEYGRASKKRSFFESFARSEETVTRRKIKTIGLDDFYRSFQPHIVGTAAVGCFLVLWEGVVAFGLMDPLFTSRPSLILMKFAELYVKTGEIYQHIYVSAQEGFIAFFLAIGVGIPLGIVMGRIRMAKYVLEPFVTALYSTPMVALIPLFILWFGIDLLSKVAVIFLGAVFPILINTQTGVEKTDPNIIEAAVSFMAKERQIFAKIVLPSAIPYIIAGLRLAMGRALIMMVVAEFYISIAGLGFMVRTAGDTYDTDTFFVGILTLTIFGVVASQIIKSIERKFAPWLFIEEE